MQTAALYNESFDTTKEGMVSNPISFWRSPASTA